MKVLGGCILADRFEGLEEYGWSCLLSVNWELQVRDSGVLRKHGSCVSLAAWLGGNSNTYQASNNCEISEIFAPLRIPAAIQQQYSKPLFKLMIPNLLAAHFC